MRQHKHTENVIKRWLEIEQLLKEHEDMTIKDFCHNVLGISQQMFYKIRKAHDKAKLNKVE